MNKFEDYNFPITVKISFSVVRVWIRKHFDKKIALNVLIVR